MTLSSVKILHWLDHDQPWNWKKAPGRFRHHFLASLEMREIISQINLCYPKFILPKLIHFIMLSQIYPILTVYIYIIHIVMLSQIYPMLIVYLPLSVWVSHGEKLHESPLPYTPSCSKDASSPHHAMRPASSTLISKRRLICMASLCRLTPYKLRKGGGLNLGDLLAICYDHLEKLRKWGTEFKMNPYSSQCFNNLLGPKSSKESCAGRSSWPSFKAVV